MDETLSLDMYRCEIAKAGMESKDLIVKNLKNSLENTDEKEDGLNMVKNILKSEYENLLEKIIDETDMDDEFEADELEAGLMKCEGKHFEYLSSNLTFKWKAKEVLRAEKGALSGNKTQH